MKVPLLDLNAQYKNILNDIKKAMDKVFTTHHYILGEQVAELEEKIAYYCHCQYAVGCASGSDALMLSLKALDIGIGDEVITTPFTFFATAGTIHHIGAKPVFVDIKEDTFNIDTDKIQEKITEKTKAIMPVHLFGQPAEMDKIMEIANEYNLKVIEDNAQGIGTKYKDKTAGTIGDIGTLSFFPSKNLGAMGDGGMCLTNDKELAEKLRCLRVHGSTSQYKHKWVGYNSRLDTLQAAVLLVKLQYLDNWSQGRRDNADYYNEQLKNVPQVITPKISNKCTSIYNQYTLRVQNRDGLLKHLRNNNIGCAIYYPLPLHLQECFAYLGGKEGDYPVAEKSSKEVISIPIYAELTKEQQDYIIEKIKGFYV